MAIDIGIRALGQSGAALLRLLGNAPVDLQRVRIPVGEFAACVWLAGLGLLRNGLEIALGIEFNRHWYSWDPDIALSMAAYPLFLCFYGGRWVCGLARWRGASISPQTVYGAAFAVQLLHAMIPFLDWVGNIHFGWPKIFYLTPFRPHLFCVTLIAMSTGILTAWMLAGRAFWRLLRAAGLSRADTLLVLFLAFNALFWPIYVVFPTFNTIFEWVTRTPLGSGAFYGYGVFFLLGSLPGLRQWRRTAHG